MPLRLHNTLTGRVETFVPLQPERVSFYSCGPTVYDFAHIGNFRSFLAADVLRRWLESPLCERVAPQAEGPRPPSGSPDPGGAPGTAVPRAGGYRVTHIMNITDVGHLVDDSALDSAGEDRMEAARQRLLQDKKSGKLPPEVAARVDPNDPFAIANFYADAFIEDAKLMRLKVVSDAMASPKGFDWVMPRPTRMIKEMLEMIMTLLARGHAYIAPGPDGAGVCYFDTQTFPDYGRLSGNTLDKIRSGAGGRVSAAVQSAKKHPADFMLWKSDPKHLMRWDPKKVLGDPSCPLGEGYPGWHIECSAMARSRLGDVIDLHSGGEDNIFPHHECEIAQSRGATDQPWFARYWFHPRFLMVEGAKMSKSRGNFFTVRDVVARGFSPEAIRLELIRTHYRSNANFTEQGLKDCQRMIDRWREFVGVSKPDEAFDPARLPEEARRAAAEFADAMNDDLNIAGAIGAINSWMNRAASSDGGGASLMHVLDGVLAVMVPTRNAGPESLRRSEEDAAIDDLVRRRTEARRTKNWAEADRIRDELNRLNIVVEDTPQGPKWSRKATL